MMGLVPRLPARVGRRPKARVERGSLCIRYECILTDMGLRASGRGLAAAAVAVAVAVACDSDDSSAGGGAGGAGGGDAAVEAGWGTSACGTCVASSCSSERTTCMSEPTCATYLSCLDACPADASGNLDSTCVSACPAPADSAAAKAKDAFEACRQFGPGASCAGCGASDAGSGNPFEGQVCAPSTDPNPCHQCYDEHCCDADQGCYGSAECMKYVDCIGPCGGAPACLAQCAIDFRDGAEEFLWSITCDTVYCPNCPSPDPCAECEVTKCQSTYIACTADVDCFLFKACQYGCKIGDTACTSACEASVPAAAVAKANAYTFCRQYYCGPEC